MDVCKGSIAIAEKYLDDQKNLRQPQIKIYDRQLVFQIADLKSTLRGQLYFQQKHIRFWFDYEDSFGKTKC